MRPFGLATIATSFVLACTKPPPAPPPEAALRASLGIPPNAKRVVVFAQTSHLDIDWQETFDDYYSSWGGTIFPDARKLLDAQPRAFYSVAEMAFWQHRREVLPEERTAIVAQAKRGAGRIVGGGLPSPDTLLPETELIARDDLYGAKFSEDILQRTLELLASRVEEGFVVGGTPRAEARRIDDVFANRGAPGGLHAACASARTTRVLVLGADLPSVRPEVLAVLWHARAKQEPIAATLDGRAQPLHAFFRAAACARPFGEALRSGPVP